MVSRRQREQPEIPYGTIRVRVTISGRVQGVGFRYSLGERATQLGLKGWVRNLFDGRVEAAFEGPPGEVEAAVAWCRRGPAGARVDEVTVVSETPVGETRFRVRETADGGDEA